MTKPETEFQKIAGKLAADKVEVSKMFGMPCYKIKGKAFAGLYEGEMDFKLSGEDHKSALALKGSALFDPMGGRPMKEWVQVPGKHLEQWESFAKEALKYVRSLKK